MDFVVYTYSVPGEEKPFYVGKGKPGRPHDHFRISRRNLNTHFYHKLNKLIDNGIYPIVKIVASGLNERQAFDLEISLIAVYGRLDQGTGCLTNHTDGGEGGCGRAVTIDTRIKMSKPRSIAAKVNMAASQNKTPVESFDLTTGKTIRQYPSLASVKLDGYVGSNVLRVVRGLARHTGLVGWRYSKKEAV